MFYWVSFGLCFKVFVRKVFCFVALLWLVGHSILVDVGNILLIFVLRVCNA